jgi:GH35 family endo-1,4-beta-xylanase
MSGDIAEQSTTDGAAAPENVAAARALADPSVAHRLGHATLTLVDAAGRPLADREVTVEQTRHAFGFGNIGFSQVPLANGEATGDALRRATREADLWLELFNIATLPFYWARFEPERGRPDTERLRRAAQWFVQRGVPVKGHPLLWHTLAPPWLLGSSLDEVEAVARARVTRDVTEFAGLIDLWDAINEVVIMPVFEKEDNAITRLAAVRGRVAMVRLAIGTARAANPAARLVLNDFDLSADYEHLIEECLSAGIVIDALGLQTHMHQGYRGAAEIVSIVDRFARYGLPIQLTETTLVSGDLMPPHIVDLNDWQVPSWPSTEDGEARQADELVRHYRSLVAHPAVESICYWGLSDAGAWLGAPAGLVRTDGTEKPSYLALRDLVKGEWWLPSTTVRTDCAGRVRVDAFAGDLRVTAGAASTTVPLPTGTSAAILELSPLEKIESGR